MELNIAICDDDTTDITAIQSHLQTFQIQYDIDFHITLFKNGHDLLDSHMVSNSYHIIFIDVEMPRLNGLETAQEIRKRADYDVKIIFVSNYPKYMQDSFNVQAFHYLQKPLQYDTTCTLLNRIIQQYKDTHASTLILPHDDMEEVVFIKNIIYIESLKTKKETLKFVLLDKTIQVKGALKNYEILLQKYSFAIPHRGYYVNLDHIHFFKNDTLILSNKESIPLSRRSEKTLRALFSKHILQTN